MPTYKDINELTQKSSVSGTEKLPVSDTEFITPDQITESVNAQLSGGDGEIRKNYSWSPGYVASPTIIASSVSQFCQPVKFHKGEKLTYKTNNNYGSAVVEAYDDTPLSVGSRDFVKQILINAPVANVTHTYTFPSDMWVVISVMASDYKLDVTMTDAGALSARVSALETRVGNIGTIPSALSDLSDDDTHRVVTDTEKSTWNAKQNAITVSSSEPTSSQGNNGDIWIVI